MCPRPSLPFTVCARKHTHTHAPAQLAGFPRVDHGDSVPLLASVPTPSKLKILSNSQRKDALNSVDPWSLTPRGTKIKTFGEDKAAAV